MRRHVHVPWVTTNTAQTLPFEKVKHNLSTLDAQPANNGVLILVTGQLLVQLYFIFVAPLHPIS